MIHSKSEAEHFSHLETILKELDLSGLKRNPDKCKFFRKETQYLGYKLNLQGIEMEPERIKVIQEFERPKNLKNLRGFLGMVGYFKRLVS